MAVLSRVAGYDIYHLPEYHEVAERGEEGEARLFVFSEGEYTIALPLLLRSCAAVAGLSGESSLDATSVYGYAGPVSSHENPPASVIASFQEAIRSALEDLGVVAVFSRLHPLLPQARLVTGLGETAPSGTTVSIDLTLPAEAQVARFRPNHRTDLRKLRLLGARSVHRANESAIDDFVGIYHETMRRVGADEHYLFDTEYFARLVELLGSHVDFFACYVGDDVACAGLFFSCNGIVQYHLGGTRARWLKSSPMKLLIDDVRLWATGCGMQVFHLGGGVGAQQDSLFHFKSGFSDRRHPFAVWRWILDQGEYDRLTQLRVAWNAQHGVDFTSSTYFPQYRCPTMSIDAPADQSPR